MSKWIDIELGDFIELKRGYDLPKKNRVDGQVSIISSSGESGCHNAAKVKGPGVVTGRYGTIGGVYYTEKDFWPLNTTLYVKDFKGNDPLFVYYFLKTIRFSDYSDKAAVPGINRNHLHKARIRVPVDPDYQKELARKLWSLDSKISLNQQTNQTLEAIAQTLFKSWFVDFDPVKAKLAVLAAGGSAEEAERAAMCAISARDEASLNTLQTEQPEAYAELARTAALFPSAMQDSELGEIPEGWEAKPLGNYLEIKRGGSPRPIKEYIVDKGLPWTKIADATSEPSPFLFKTRECIKEEGLKKTVFLKRGALILSNSATPGLPKFLELDACIHDGWLHFPSKKLFSDVYLYQLFLEIRKALVAQGNGSVFTNLKTDILRNQVVIVPSQEIIDQFDKTAAIIFEKLKEVCKEINSLVELRDTLLPKLLAGEISVKDEVKEAVYG
ncbi:restriction endonuclease subunit S [Kistimonas scapharcae]|uniref:Restriction endonuclease subunit S n=1 Tax=Kistimonas scapharcae TaxID=1036133 RepID=A0ABP8UZ66_9GAMM